MGGNYEKNMYNQLMEVMARLDSVEKSHNKAKKEIKRLNSDVKSLRNENMKLKEEINVLKTENTLLKTENDNLKKENLILKNDNERMKRILGNDSNNSSIPPSKDEHSRPANTYNSRKATKKKPGGQPGHKGNHISKENVEDKIAKGIYEHHIEDIGTVENPYITRYRLDLDIKVTAAEIRIHADENGKFHVPGELKSEVFYGENIRSIAAFLYSEGVVANDRICTFINSISGDSLNISAGAVYGFCKKFSNLCHKVRPILEEQLLNGEEICTDATVISTNGKQTYIRNFSTADSVLYYSSNRKNLETLKDFRILKDFTGTFVHDHETAIYNFGMGHGECNVHLERYLMKNTEETGNTWSRDLSCFMLGMNKFRNRLIINGMDRLSEKHLEKYETRYDEIIAAGREQNKKTKGRLAKKEEKTLLNRLEKYKENHLLFLHDFKVHFSNNMSEKDLRICKNRQKMAGGFRTPEGRNMYCDIISFIETVKRRKLNIFKSIKDLMNGTPVIE